MTQEITGATLIAWGFEPAKWFKSGIEEANRLRAAGESDEAIIRALTGHKPVEIEMRSAGRPFGVYLEAEGELEERNREAVVEHMTALMRVPTIVAGAVMPDACPSGSAPGTIPVGGVVAAEDAIHPGFHSADICCSVAISLFRREDNLKRFLDVAETVTHFGPGARKVRAEAPASIAAEFEANDFLKGIDPHAHFMTQGDGNHFLYVGRLASTGQPAIVTHHGSRGPGAALYKRGMIAARRHTAIVAPRVPHHQSWIKADSHHGEEYWKALQIIRRWTKANHFAIHDEIARRLGNRVADRWWNEHNFVFRKTDGLFYHGKGATPNWRDFSADDAGVTLIPLNMAEPILIAGHRDQDGSLGFAPHGAGRNMGRKAFLREAAGSVADELEALRARGLDIRSYCGTPDHSELPSAYKDAASVRRQIESFGLADVVDTIEPFGSIMAGDWEKDAPWRKAREAAQ